MIFGRIRLLAPVTSGMKSCYLLLPLFACTILHIARTLDEDEKQAVRLVGVDGDQGTY